MVWYGIHISQSHTHIGKPQPQPQPQLTESERKLPPQTTYIYIYIYIIPPPTTTTKTTHSAVYTYTYIHSAISTIQKISNRIVQANPKKKITPLNQPQRNIKKTPPKASVSKVDGRIDRWLDSVISECCGMRRRGVRFGSVRRAGVVGLGWVAGKFGGCVLGIDVKDVE